MLLDEQTHRVVLSNRSLPRDQFSIRDLAFPVLLGFLILSLSALTQSLLIFSLGLLQGAHILVRLHGLSRQKPGASASQLHGWWVLLLLFFAFALLLSSGHILVETYWRLTEPTQIPALTAFWGISVVFAGQTLIEKGFQFKIYRPFPAAKLPGKRYFQLAFLMSILAFLTIYWTDFFWIDALLGGLFSLPLFLGAVFASLDAYWRLEEIA